MIFTYSPTKVDLYQNKIERPSPLLASRIGQREDGTKITVIVGKSKCIRPQYKGSWA